MEYQSVFTPFYPKEGSSIGQNFRFQASLASVPQPSRTKVGYKIRFSVLKEHALKGHRLDWYSDLSDFPRFIITISTKFGKDFTMWPRVRNKGCFERLGSTQENGERKGYGTQETLGWFSKRTGTSLDDCARGIREF